MTGSDPVSYPYSSYPYYLGKKKAPWVKPYFILSYFDNSRNHPELNKYLSYQEFVEGYGKDPKDSIGHFALDFRSLLFRNMPFSTKCCQIMAIAAL